MAARSLHIFGDASLCLTFILVPLVVQPLPARRPFPPGVLFTSSDWGFLKAASWKDSSGHSVLASKVALSTSLEITHLASTEWLLLRGPALGAGGYSSEQNDTM